MTTAADVELEFEPEPVLGEPVPMNVLLYGPPKSGKTAGAASAPGPVLLLTADTPNATRYAQLKYPGKVKVMRVKGLTSLVNAANWLNHKGADTKTVIVDTVSEIYRVLLEDLSNRAMRPSLPIYGDAQKYLERFCRELCEDPRFTTVVVAHEMTVESDVGDDGTRTEKLPYLGTGKDKLAQKLMGMVDIVGYTAAVQVVDQEGEPPRTVYAAQLLNTAGRRGGDRFDVLGSYRELDLTEWVSLVSSAAPESFNKPTEEPSAPVEAKGAVVA